MPARFTLAALALSAALVMSCNNENNGTLLQHWTIAGATNPTACGALGAAQMRLVVLNDAGDLAASAFAPCTDFQTVLSLEPRFYSGAATFLDSRGAPVSRTRPVLVFDILHDETTSLTVNFAPDDFPP